VRLPVIDRRGMALLAALAALIAATATYAADPADANVHREIVASQPTFKVEVQTSRAVHTVDVSTCCSNFTPIRLDVRSWCLSHIEWAASVPV